MDFPNPSRKITAHFPFFIYYITVYFPLLLPLLKKGPVKGKNIIARQFDLKPRSKYYGGKYAEN